MIVFSGDSFFDRFDAISIYFFNNAKNVIVLIWLMTTSDTIGNHHISSKCETTLFEVIDVKCTHEYMDRQSVCSTTLTSGPSSCFTMSSEWNSLNGFIETFMKAVDSYIK